MKEYVEQTFIKSKEDGFFDKFVEMLKEKRKKHHLEMKAIHGPKYIGFDGS